MPCPECVHTHTHKNRNRLSKVLDPVSNFKHVYSPGEVSETTQMLKIRNVCTLLAELEFLRCLRATYGWTDASAALLILYLSDAAPPRGSRNADHL